MVSDIRPQAQGRVDIETESIGPSVSADLVAACFAMVDDKCRSLCYVARCCLANGRTTDKLITGGGMTPIRCEIVFVSCCGLERYRGRRDER